MAKIFSKKALAVVLTVAMLLSCMVFSFSADAKVTRLYVNGFDNPTEDNWAYYLSGTNTTHVSGGNAIARYDATYGAMKLSLTGTTFSGTGGYGDGYHMSGFRMFSQGTEGSKLTGDFSITTPGWYKVSLDYSVLTFDEQTVTVDLCVGFNNADGFYWENNVRTTTNFSYSTRKAVVSALATFSKDDLGDSGKLETYMYLDDALSRSLNIYIRPSDGFKTTMQPVAVLVDNVEVFSCDEEDLPVETLTLLWENDFTGGTNANWYAAYGPDAGSYGGSNWYYNFLSSPISYKGNKGNQVTVDATGDMEYTFLNEAGESNTVSSAILFHKAATSEGAYDAYGTSSTASAHNAIGRIFTAANQKYAIEFDYKVDEFNADSTSKVGLYLGLSNDYLDGDKTIASNFSGTGKAHSLITTVGPSDKGKGWAKAIGTITSSDTRIMHLFAAVIDNDPNALTNAKISVDNIKIYLYNDRDVPAVNFVYGNDVVGTAKGLKGMLFNAPELDMVIPDGYELQYYTDADCTQIATLPTVFSGEAATYYVALVKLPKEAVYQNDFSNPTADNWGKYLNQVSPHISKGSITTASCENGAMKLTLSGDANNGTAREAYLSGFRLYNGTATTDAAGSISVPAGHYVMTFDYKVDSFTSTEDAQLEIVAGLAKDMFWDGSDNPPKNKTWFSGLYGAKKYWTGKTAAVVTGTTDGWVTATVLIDAWDHATDGAINRAPHILIKASENTTGSMKDTTVLIDNVKMYKYDISITNANDREQYLYRANVGTEEEPVYTNLHRNTKTGEGTYTSLRLGVTYTAGDESGKTIILNGVEYEIAERGLLVGTAGSALDLGDASTFKWKSSKSSNFDSYWEGAESAGGYDVTFTLRLANMDESWFEKTDEYQYRSYYKVKAPDFESDDGFVIYGEVGEAFTFAELAGDFEKDAWFN